MFKDKGLRGVAEGGGSRGIWSEVEGRAQGEMLEWEGKRYIRRVSSVKREENDRIMKERCNLWLEEAGKKESKRKR